MTVDLSGIEQQLLQILGIALASIAIWAVQRFAAKLGVDKNAQIVATLDDAVTKGINGGVMQATEAIKAKGWDDVTVHNQIAGSAVAELASHAQVALTNAGYDPSTAQGQADIKELVMRALPDALTSAAASPATPPANAGAKQT